MNCERDHPNGASATRAPTRTATILRDSYFLDRFLWSLLAILAALVPALAIGNAFPSGGGRLVVTCVPGECEAAYAAAKSWRASLQPYPFDTGAPVAEQFGQLAWNVFTWEPLAIILLGCGVLAVVLQRYAY